MPIVPMFHKVCGHVAAHSEMFELLNLPPDRTIGDIASGECYAGQWFEVERHSYETMLEVLPPLFMRHDMFAMSEVRAGFVGSVFLEIVIDKRKRWFHGYCDLSDRQSPGALRSAIIFHETGDTSGMTREQVLDAIWLSTHRDFRGLAGELDPLAWPGQHRGKRTILTHVPGEGTVLKLLEDLTDAEIADRLPRRRSR